MLMNQKKILAAAIIALSVSGCALFNRSNINIPNYNSQLIKELILKAVNGDTSANYLLGNLVNLNLPLMNNYNTLSVDSMTAGGKKYYLALISFPNPAYNRFAVYDSVLNLYLVDKSLNGYITDTVITINRKKFIKVSEDYLTKDILILNRLSLYQVNDTSAGLIFRTFTKLIEPKAEYDQIITGFSDDRIVTSLSNKINSPISGKSDVFIYNYSKLKYISPNNIFDKFVEAQINGFKHKVEKPEIKDKGTLYSSVGIDIGLDTIKTTGNVRDIQGYTLTLPDNNWKVLHNFIITDLVKKDFKGTRYVNDIIGANISVILIPSQDSAEMFENYPLKNISEGKYRVRYSDKIPSMKDFVQYFELSCGVKKYILILRASKFTYDEFKSMYQGIINSFTIDC